MQDNYHSIPTLISDRHSVFIRSLFIYSACLLKQIDFAMLSFWKLYTLFRSRNISFSMTTHYSIWFLWSQSFFIDFETNTQVSCLAKCMRRETLLQKLVCKNIFQKRELTVHYFKVGYNLQKFFYAYFERGNWNI